MGAYTLVSRPRLLGFLRGGSRCLAHLVLVDRLMAGKTRPVPRSGKDHPKFHWGRVALLAIPAAAIGAAVIGSIYDAFQPKQALGDWRHQETMQWVQRSKSETYACLAGDASMYPADDCRAEWSDARRYSFYRRIVDEMPPPLY